MRFTSVVAALIAVTSITSAFHIHSTETESLERRAPVKKPLTPVIKPVTPVKKKVILEKKPAKNAGKPKKNIPEAIIKPYKRHCSHMKHKKIAARVDDTLVEYDEITYTFTVLGGGFLTKTWVEDGHILRVDNLSGCNGVYFFDGTGKASVTHIVAGTERVEARDAATKAAAEGTITEVKVYAHASSNFNAIKEQYDNDSSLESYNQVVEQHFIRDPFDNTEKSSDITNVLKLFENYFLL
ncbi:hypothetical protein M7I_7466 [Glarea lozoyensis 74030]|uniref:Uncharacterized protein n=1 Tax=Glarea lozoyensis (strain ATCC 74030 / MF5533) TaxID=1104152 RepID=H0EXD2_GLAL7|nr:hypothetical protein M7I_7466 [Glarea lozoyensis 74030]